MSVTPVEYFILFRNRNKEWHDGRGHSIRVPIYLRYDGQVKNMNLDSRLTAEMIADLMRAKEAGHNPDMRMADFLHNFVNLKYSTTTLQMEFTYNLVDGIDRFKVRSPWGKHTICIIISIEFRVKSSEP